MSARRPSEVLARAEDYLERHGVASPRVSAEVLLSHVLGVDRAGLYLRDAPLDADEARAFGRALCLRCEGTPLQHLTGEQPFRRLILEVREGVFIPRPETELLVDHALQTIAGVAEPRVVDVGTGTGAIALAIASERPDARVIAVDRSPEALSLARDNARRLGLDVDVRAGDLLDDLGPEFDGTVDLVVSNPPYVRPEHYGALPEEVRRDPYEALIGGIDVMRRIAAGAQRLLRPGRALALEIGDDQLDEVRDVLAGWRDVTGFPDLVGRERIVVARRA